ncbi:MAG TPA: hypothetical protein PKA41_05130 [Verrucomicrobiota bacterium]|nr:hypothetical protein [Verrucomicrobiota bacterium]
MKTNHTWKFFRAGGFDQLKIESGADVANLDQLDQKLWVALACPTTGVEFDTKTLALIDTDNDGRVRAPEVIAAAKWVTALLKNSDDLLKSSPSLPLDAINDATAEGKQLRSSAKQILVNLGKKDAAAISIDDTTDTVKIFAQTSFNGDGIIPVDAAEDDATKAVITDIIGCLGSLNDRSGKPGIDQARADQFFTEIAAYSDWWKKAEADKNIMPVGEATTTAAAAVRAVKAKVDDYFARCRLAAFDARALTALNRQESEYLSFAAKDLTVSAAEVASFPLAKIEADRPLPLLAAVNPAWAGALAKLHSDAVKPLLGDKQSLTEADWAALLSKLGPFECWSAGKAGASVEKLGIKRAREIAAGNARETINALIAKDKALEPEANSIAAVDRLVRYHRDLFKLLNNYVAFREFYGRRDRAVFQAGTLYLDQRSCDLCITVTDAAKHATMAGLAGVYLAYCDCVRKATGEKMQIVAAFTDGDSDNLMVGRNGIFYDRKGRDWDATIAKIIENPISVRQAFWSPYKKLVRMIEEQAAKRAAAADAESSKKLEGAATTVATADKAAATPAPSAPAKKMDVGVVAAIGVAFGAISTFLATVFTKAVELKSWQIALILVGIVLIISGPSVIIAWLKLRKRNLAPILDANGWAINAKAKINVPFGKSLTQVAELPSGSKRDLSDPYVEKKSPWPKIIVFLIVLWIAYVILNKMGFIFEWTNGRLGDPKPVRTLVVESKPESTEVAVPATTNPAPSN